MWENYRATIIQNFYKKFIKCPRDKSKMCKIKILNKMKKIASPIDPLYRTTFDDKYLIRMIEWHPNQRKACVWHFNIISLIEWLNICKEWINPMTNCLFLNKSIDRILEFIEMKKIRRKLRLNVKYNKNEKTVNKKLKIAKVEPDGKIYMDLLVKTIDENKEKDCYNLLHNNYDKIESDYFKIDEDIKKEETILGEKIGYMGVLHYGIIRNRKDIVHHLIYFGCNLEKKMSTSNYRAIHLAAIFNLVDIGYLLKIYGADLYSTCLFEGGQCNIFDICDRMGHIDFISKILDD